MRQLLLQRIQDIARLQAESFNASAEVVHVSGSPVLINSEQETDFAIGVARELVDESLICTDMPPLMGSEDFAFLLEAHPHGAYLMVGAGDGPMVHNPGYDFNDDIIVTAAAFWCLLTQRYLQ